METLILGVLLVVVTVAFALRERHWRKRSKVVIDWKRPLLANTREEMDAKIAHRTGAKLVASFPSDLPQPEIDKLRAALESLRYDGAAVIPKGVTIQVIGEDE